VDRGKDVFLDNLFAYHDCILKVVALPWHECHLEITAEGEFAALGTIALREHLSLNHLFSLPYDGDQVDCGVLVGLVVLGKLVTLDVIVKADEFLFVCPAVANDDLVCVNIFNHAVTFSDDEDS